MNTPPKSSSPEPTPIMTLTPAKEEDDPRSCRQRQLVPASRFGLPDGWFVDERPRPSGPTVDKYYIELDTGMKFRSLAAVHRYLKDGQIDVGVRREKSGSQCTMPFRKSSSFRLPDGWEIEQIPRKNTNSSHCDKYYIEPGTGKRFRSLISVERYLSEENEDTPLRALIPANKSILSSGSDSQKKIVSSWELISENSPCLNECYNSTPNAMRLNTNSTPVKHPSSPKKKSICEEASRPSELRNGSPPRKVKWVLAGPGGNMWNPFMDDCRVADSVKQKWSEIFKSSFCDENAKAPRS